MLRGANTSWIYRTHSQTARILRQRGTPGPIPSLPPSPSVVCITTPRATLPSLSVLLPTVPADSSRRIYSPTLTPEALDLLDPGFRCLPTAAYKTGQVVRALRVRPTFPHSATARVADTDRDRHCSASLSRGWSWESPAHQRLRDVSVVH